MKKWIRLIKKEDGAELIEAAIVYPVVFLCIGFLFYLGVYILQYMTLSAYAQKVAILAAREISRPGYISMIADPQKTYSTSSVEMQLADFSKGVSADSKNQKATDGSVRGMINIPTDTKSVNARAYRFWTANPIGDSGRSYEDVLKVLVDNNSIIKSNGSAEVKITSSNYIIAQYVDVDVKQKLITLDMFEAFGVETPTVHVKAKAAATDIDEFIRNTDLVVDTLEIFAKKLGIDVDKIKDKVAAAKEKLGL